MKRFMTVLVVGLVGAALLIACGGDKKPAADPSAAGSGSAPAADSASAAPSTPAS